MSQDSTGQKDMASIRQIAMVGNYVPRQCGIATFTADLSEALAAVSQSTDVFTVAMNEADDIYAYPPRVHFELGDQDLEGYRRAADYLNLRDVDVVCVQHEFGIYGGLAGSHIVELLGSLRMPAVTVLHTVLREPDRYQRSAMHEIARLSERLVVMSQRSVDLLRDIYLVPPNKIDLIPHGIPDLSFVDPNFYKDGFDAEGKVILLTFGLLSPNKGIENVIEALPEIVAQNPNVIYIVLGATHPHVKRQEGEKYREMLQGLARERGVGEHVIFYNEFVSGARLIEFIGGADIYITPYLNEEQVVSGTLAYTVGTGKAVVSTPYWHAQELLSDGRGILVPFRDPSAIAHSVNELIENEVERHAMRKRAYMHGREMIWPVVAQRYLEVFQRARADRPYTTHGVGTTLDDDRQVYEMPSLNLRHLMRMTDDTGMLQHATHAVPNYHEGYSIDDNARALIAAIELEELGTHVSETTTGLATRYLAYLWYAFNPEAGRFRNFLSYDRRWLEEVGSEDSHGRAIWGLGTVLGRSTNEGLVGTANKLFDDALPAALDLTFPRSWAFVLLGIEEYLQRFSGDRRMKRAREVLVERLLEMYRTHSSEVWPWFEDTLTYDNAALPRALLLAGRGMGREDAVQAGLTSLSWLVEVQRAERGHFVPIGSYGFYPRGGERARFDQQPIEAYSTVVACLGAHRVTGDATWLKHARVAFEWFLGRNDLSIPLYDPATGGCCDGLKLDRTNQNEGAESTLAFLLSSLALRLAENSQKVVLLDGHSATWNRPAHVTTREESTALGPA